MKIEVWEKDSHSVYSFLMAVFTSKILIWIITNVSVSYAIIALYLILKYSEISKNFNLIIIILLGTEVFLTEMECGPG